MVDDDISDVDVVIDEPTPTPQNATTASSAPFPDVSSRKRPGSAIPTCPTSKRRKTSSRESPSLQAMEVDSQAHDPTTEPLPPASNPVQRRPRQHSASKSNHPASSDKSCQSQAAKMNRTSNRLSSNQFQVQDTLQLASPLTKWVLFPATGHDFKAKFNFVVKMPSLPRWLFQLAQNGSAEMTLVHHDVVRDELFLNNILTRYSSGEKSNRNSRSTQPLPSSMDGGAQYIFDIDDYRNFVFKDVDVYPGVDRQLGLVSVFYNKEQVIGRTHVDADDALFFMLAGRKTFRVSLTTGRRAAIIPVFSKGHATAIRRGWVDIDLKPGDVLFVPKDIQHAVLSQANSVGLSLTMSHLQAHPSHNRFDFDYVRPRPPYFNDSDQSIPGPPPYGEFQSLHANSNSMDAALLDIENRRLPSPPITYEGSASEEELPTKTYPARQNEQTDPLLPIIPDATPPHEGADVDTDSLQVFIQSQNAPAETVLSEKFSKCLNDDSIPFVHVTRDVDGLANAVSALSKELLCDNATLSPLFNHDDLPVALLFGQNVPLKGDWKGEKLLSGRVSVPLNDLCGLYPQNVLLNAASKKLQKIVTKHVQKEYGSGQRVTVVRASVLLRPNGRVEAQREHVDGDPSNGGKSTMISCIIPLSHQMAPLFLDMTSEEAIARGILGLPELEVGDIVFLDADRAVHMGYQSSVTSPNELYTVALFMAFEVVPLTSTPSLKGLLYGGIEDDEVGYVPHDILAQRLRVPAVASCACCRRLLVNRCLEDVCMCSKCLECEPVHRGGSVFICDACARWPKASMTPEMLDLLRRVQGENVINAYMLRSLISGNNNWRVCNHDTTLRQRVSIPMAMLLYLRMDEVVDIAKWFVKGLVGRAFIIEDLIDRSKYEDEDALDNFLRDCLGGCGRAHFAARAMLKSMNVHFVYNSFETSTSLATSTGDNGNASEYVKLMYTRGRSAVDFMLKPAVDQKFFVDLGDVVCDSIRRRDPREIDLRCTCRASSADTNYCYAFTSRGMDTMFGSEASQQVQNYTQMSFALRALMKASLI